MNPDALDKASQAAPSLPSRWRQRLFSRLGDWCDLLLDTHHARIPF